MQHRQVSRAFPVVFGLQLTLYPSHSAHQMGSNQMSTKATTGVVDPRGRVWGTESLYIADASVFPTASAVNPMITVSAAYATSRWPST